MLTKIILTIIIVVITSAASAHDNRCFPSWVANLIKKFESEPVGNPPRSIWRYEYKGKIVYYLPEQCCDLGSELLDEEGVKLCSPDGGYAGIGDGRCKDFLAARKHEKLIWKDSRKID